MKEIIVKDSWDKVSLGEFIAIDKILKTIVNQDVKILHIIAILTGEKVEHLKELPVATYNALVNSVGFVATKPEANKLKNEYNLSGRIYELKANIPDITTAQYIDYQGVMANDDRALDRLMSCFLVPKGKKYGESDIDSILKDVNEMPIKDAMAVSFFLRKQYGAYILILAGCLRKQLKKMKVSTETLTSLQARFNSMASSLWCCE